MSFINVNSYIQFMVENKKPVSKPNAKEKETKKDVSKQSSKVKSDKKTDKKVESKTSKKSETKKSESKKTQTKSTKKSDSKKESDKKVESKVDTKTSKTSETKKKKISEAKMWKVLSTILVIVVLFLAVAIGIRFFSTDNTFESDLDKKVEDLNNPVANTNNQEKAEDIKSSLLIVEDKTCANCQVDFLAEQIKINLIPNLTVEKVEYDSEVGLSITNQLGIKIAPIFLFSKNLEQRDDWEKLASVMIPVQISGEDLLLLNPMAIEFKTLIEEPIQTETAITIGDENAKVTLVEFSDFECPVCALMKGSPKLTEEFKAQNADFVPTIPKIMEEYVETGKVKYVFYNFPIDRIHPSARAAHNAGLCANEQSKFKEYSDSLYENREEWVESKDKINEVLIEFADDLELDKSEFETCLNNQKYNSQIDEEMKLALPYGVAGTPTYFVNKQIISGLVDYETFKSVIESELDKSN